MKKKFFPTIGGILTFCLISVLLMSYIPKQKNETKFNDNLNIPNIDKLVDSVFNDPVYELIYKKDIQNIIFQTSSNSLINKDILEKLSKKSKFSEDEINYIISTVIGFKDQKDFNNFVDLYRYLIEKYNVNKFNKNDQKYFFNALKNKEIEYTGELVELSKNSSKLDSLNKLYSGTGGIRPECWKCIYDYQACLNPVVGTTLTTVTHISNATVQLSINNGPWMTYSITIFNDPQPPNSITYTAPIIQTNPCTIMYKSCVSQCNQP